MKVRAACPDCGRVATLDQFVDEADAKQYCQLVGNLPPAVARALFDYLRLFSPPKRALAWSRALRLTREINTAIERGSIERHGRTWAAPMPVWAPALQAVVDKQHRLSLPLKDNAYLFEVIASGANRDEGHAEAERERKRRQRSDGHPAKPRERRPIAPEAEPAPAGSRSAPIPGGSLKTAVAQATARLRQQSHTDSETDHE